MGDPEWFRASRWDAGTAERFEALLRRARASNRAQYIRIQASHLVESPDAVTREIGRALLRRVIDDYPDDDFETKCAWEQLGDSLATEGRLDDAENALRETLRRIHASATGASGTSGTTELRLAEVLIYRGDTASIDQAGQLLAIVEPAVRTQAFLRDVLYRYFLACARVAHAQHAAQAAAELACAALRVADDISTPLPRHPAVGRTHPTYAERAELHSIASAE